MAVHHHRRMVRLSKQCLLGLLLTTAACSDPELPPISACSSDCDCPASMVCVMRDRHRECASGTNSCFAPETDMGPPGPDLGPEVPELTFDPSNLRGTVHGAPFPERAAEVSDWCTIDTDEGTNSCGYAHFEVRTQGDGSSVGVFFMRSLHFVEGARGRVRGSRPAVLVVLEDVILEAGELLVSAGGAVGPERLDGPVWGNGPGGGGYHVGSFDASGSGGSFCSAGGLGARASESTRGRTYGMAALEPLLGGSSGGTSGGLVGGNAGDGGGALQIVSGTRIRVGPAMRVAADGERGGGQSEGAGGGSGGALLLEAPIIEIDGQLTVSGGSGGTVPGDGAYLTSFAQDGGEDLGLYSDFGGGGGGFGWLRLNTADGEVDIAIDSLVSPAPSITACFSTGTLHPKTAAPAPGPGCEATTLPDDSCGECMGSMCCADLRACEADELCATCWTAETPGPACSADELLATLRACISSSCPAACP